jgi:hypothetical protein
MNMVGGRWGLNCGGLIRSGGCTSWHHRAEPFLSRSLARCHHCCWWGWVEVADGVYLFQLIGVSPETSHADWSINCGNQSQGWKEYTKGPRNEFLWCTPLGPSLFRNAARSVHSASVQLHISASLHRSSFAANGFECKRTFILNATTKYNPPCEATVAWLVNKF